MTPADFRSALERLHLTQAAAAAVFGYQPRQVRWWLAGRPIPPLVSRVMALMLAGRLHPMDVEKAEEER